MATTTKSIKGTQTEKNLAIAFLSESQANARYTFYAQQADKENYYPIGEVFRETAANELHHGKVYFKILEGGHLDVAMGVDTGIIGTTAENLAIAINEEQDDANFYIQAAQTAEAEGFPDVAEHFRSISEVEETHKRRFQAYLDQVNAGTVWKRDKPITWRCMVCGFEYTGTEPPQVCPGCSHPYQHYIGLDMATL